jgi:fructose-1,6-bisphosphatase II / sedoheptulose-1,7-bisphosphatase
MRIEERLQQRQKYVQKHDARFVALLSHATTRHKPVECDAIRLRAMGATNRTLGNALSVQSPHVYARLNLTHEGDVMTDKLEFKDRMLSLGLARVSEAAAIASAKLIGRGDEKAADQAAVNAMREQLNLLDIKGVVVIGEGERDEAPMLYIGEEVGTGAGIAVDIALDPLEGTTLTAKDMPNALTVIAMGPRGSMLHAPDVYMDKLAVGPGYPDGIVDLDMSPAERVRAVAKYKGVDPSRINVCVLERPRHEKMIEELRAVGCAIRLIPDGDVAGVIHCAESEATGIDMYMGQGGAPEGVLAAAALKCMGGQIQGRLKFRNSDERTRAEKAGIEDLNRIYTRDDMVRADVIFAATGVTDGSILPGIKRVGKHIETETLLMRSATRSVRRLTYRTTDF